jgi:ketosteroid isomerase-like protein
VFERAFDEQDVETLSSPLTDDAVFTPEPGTAVSGEAIGQTVQGFLALNAPIHMSLERCLVSGDLALIVAEWRLNAVDETGAPLHLAGTTADVARRSPEDGWHNVIDNPFGTA